jgi:hypothetical protein
MHSKTFSALLYLAFYAIISAKLLVQAYRANSGKKDPFQYSRISVTKPAGAQEKIA